MVRLSPAGLVLTGSGVSWNHGPIGEGGGE